MPTTTISSEEVSKLIAEAIETHSTAALEPLLSRDTESAAADKKIPVLALQHADTLAAILQTAFERSCSHNDPLKIFMFFVKNNLLANLSDEQLAGALVSIALQIIAPKSIPYGGSHFGCWDDTARAFDNELKRRVYFFFYENVITSLQRSRAWKITLDLIKANKAWVSVDKDDQQRISSISVCPAARSSALFATTASTCAARSGVEEPSTIEVSKLIAEAIEIHSTAALEPLVASARESAAADKRISVLALQHADTLVAILQKAFENTGFYAKKDPLKIFTFFVKNNLLANLSDEQLANALLKIALKIIALEGKMGGSSFGYCDFTASTASYDKSRKTYFDLYVKVIALLQRPQAWKLTHELIKADKAWTKLTASEQKQINSIAVRAETHVDSSLFTASATVPASAAYSDDKEPTPSMSIGFRATGLGLW